MKKQVNKFKVENFSADNLVCAEIRYIKNEDGIAGNDVR